MTMITITAIKTAITKMMKTIMEMTKNSNITIRMSILTNKRKRIMINLENQH